MTKMVIKFVDGKNLIFKLYDNLAPVTVKKLSEAMPQLVKFMHARFNGEAVFFTADFITSELPEENPLSGKDMKAGYISIWRGSKGFGSKALHIWYGDDVAGNTAENLIGEYEGDIKDLNELGLNIWKEGPDIAMIYVMG